MLGAYILTILPEELCEYSDHYSFFFAPFRIINFARCLPLLSHGRTPTAFAVRHEIACAILYSWKSRPARKSTIRSPACVDVVIMPAESPRPEAVPTCSANSRAGIDAFQNILACRFFLARATSRLRNLRSNNPTNSRPDRQCCICLVTQHSERQHGQGKSCPASDLVARSEATGLSPPGGTPPGGNCRRTSAVLASARLIARRSTH